MAFGSVNRTLSHDKGLLRASIVTSLPMNDDATASIMMRIKASRRTMIPSKNCRLLHQCYSSDNGVNEKLRLHAHRPACPISQGVEISTRTFLAGRRSFSVRITCGIYGALPAAPVGNVPHRHLLLSPLCVARLRPTCHSMFHGRCS